MPAPNALGSFSFVEDFLALYSTLYPGGPAIRLRPARAAASRSGGGCRRSPRRKWYQRPFDFVFVHGGRVAVSAPAPAPLASPNPPPAAEPRVPAEMLTRSLGQDLTARMRGAATRAGATINDLLLCNLFVTLKRWNAATWSIDQMAADPDSAESADGRRQPPRPRPTS